MRTNIVLGSCFWTSDSPKRYIPKETETTIKTKKTQPLKPTLTDFNGDADIFTSFVKPQKLIKKISMIPNMVGIESKLNTKIIETKDPKQKEDWIKWVHYNWELLFYLSLFLKNLRNNWSNNQMVVKKRRFERRISLHFEVKMIVVFINTRSGMLGIGMDNSLQFVL